MQLTVLDGEGNPQTVIVAGVEVATSTSGDIITTGVSQALLAANVNRSGWVIQNQSAEHPMALNELGGVANLVPGNDSILIGPGEFFPPAGWPLSATAINIAGTQGDAFVVREW